MSFETAAYGKYEIKSGPLSGKWAANAYRRKTLIAKASGDSRQEAVAAVTAKLDEIDSHVVSTLDQEGAPSAKVYVAAFEILLPDFPDSYVAMLRAHLHSTDQLISATKLAEAAGYQGYEGANLHYGMLGQRVADEIGFVPPKRENGKEIWTCTIARDPSLDTEFPETSMLDGLLRGLESQHFEWQMRPQVVEALRSLGF